MNRKSLILSVLIIISLLAESVVQAKNQVSVETPGDVIQISGQYGHNLALLSDGTVWSWGYNVYGQLGDGSSGDDSNRSEPKQVTDLTDVVAISTGEEFSVALKSDGTVWTWGNGRLGSLGNSKSSKGINTKEMPISDFVALRETFIQPYPIKVESLQDVVSISTGAEHALALKNDGTVWSWGYNRFGQVGVFYGENKEKVFDSPVQIIGLSDVIQVAAGRYHSLAVKKDGTLWAWGRNDFGVMGDGTATEHTQLDADSFIESNNQDRYVPQLVKDLKNVVSVKAVDQYYNLATLKDGSVMHWGADPFHVDTSGLSQGTKVPLNNDLFVGMKEISADSNRVIILKNDGTVWGRGSNHSGALGNGTEADNQVFTLNKRLSNITSISGSGAHTIALDNNGQLWGWGANYLGQVAPGQYSFSEPVKIDIPPIIKVKLNGKMLSFDVYPIIENDATFVPLRKIFESLGAEMSWSSDTQTIDAVKGETQIRLTVGEQEATVNGKQVHLEKPPIVRNNRTLVPVRFIVETFGGNVGWDEEKRVVDLRM